MARKNTGRILADELHRVLEEFVDLDDEIKILVTERRRLATLAHNLQRILYSTVRPKTAEKLITELGLAELIAKLPGVPGRKPAPPAPVKRTKKQSGPAPKKAATTEAPAVLKKGTGVRMLAGIYTDWTGIIRWISVKGTRVTYAVALMGPEGKSARTQVAPRSIGKKWVVDATVVPPKKRKGRKTKRKGATKKKAAGKSKAK